MGGEPDADDALLFFLAYDDGQASLDVHTAIQYLQRAKSSNLCDQIHSKKKGTAWMDDRCYEQGAAQELAVPCVPPGGHNLISTVRTVSPDASDVEHTTSEGPPCTTDLSQGSPSVVADDAAGSSNNNVNALPSLPCANLETLFFQIPAPLTSRSPRIYIAPLTAGELHTLLREKRFNHPKYLDAHRRLICISDPDSYDFLTLIKNATAQEKRALRDGICNYLALYTSIKAIISEEEAFREFRLTFDIPYFALRRSRPEQDYPERKKREHRGWMNVSFLDADPAEPDEVVWGIHLAHISVSVSGIHNSNWTGYCFDDRHFDEDGEIGKDEQTADHQSDQIARGELSAKDVIGDPREYYLRVFHIRMRQVRKEWLDLECFILKGIKDLSWGRLFFSTTRSGIPTESNDATALNSIESTSKLVGKLLGEIVKLNAAWACFTSAKGGFDYFSDMCCNQRVVSTVHELDDIFGDMLQLEKRLRHLAEQCDKTALAINLRLTSESNKNAELTVYIISPVAVVCTFFAIPVPILDFDRNFLSFGVAIALCIVGLHGLLFLWGGRLWRQPWWERISRRAKAAWNGDPSLITMDDAGKRRLRRRATHAGFG
jgi:hypothetical protein